MPKDLPTVYDDYGQKHTLQHSLQCKVGGLIAISSRTVLNDPIVIPCRDNKWEGSSTSNKV
eukprot:15354889-Ditylum_brightwellii.AAC.2